MSHEPRKGRFGGPCAFCVRGRAAAPLGSAGIM